MLNVKWYVAIVHAPNLVEADVARRQNDYLGRPGFEAKRGQKDPVFLRKGFWRFEYKSRETAKKYQLRVARACGPEVRVEIKWFWKSILPPHQGHQSASPRRVIH